MYVILCSRLFPAEICQTSRERCIVLMMNGSGHDVELERVWQCQPKFYSRINHTVL